MKATPKVRPHFAPQASPALHKAIYTEQIPSFMFDNIIGDADIGNQIACRVLDIYIPHMERGALVQETGISRHGVTLGHRFT